MGGKEKDGRVGGKGKGGERGEDVEGPGKWSAPGPVLALGGPGYRTFNPSVFSSCSHVLQN